MLSFYLLCSIVYFSLLGLLSFFWRKKRSVPVDFSTPTWPVTLLIPFRNEEKNIPILVDSLRKIVSSELKIFLIDDQSTDSSWEVASRCMQQDSRISLLSSPGEGKKDAISYGVLQADTEWILTSDADCQFSPDWVARLQPYFEKDNAQLIAGAVQVNGKEGFLTVFQRLDWASIALVSQVAMDFERPLMCSAANLAFRKSAFEAVNGYEGNKNYLSGDDEFLLKKIADRFGKDSCVADFSSHNLVLTQAENAWRDFFNQRARWASKWNLHNSVLHAFQAVIPFVIQLFWIASWGLLGLGWEGVVCFLSIWTVKILAERLALGKVLRSFEIPVPWFHYVMTSLVHPWYILAVGIWSFSPRIRWKGRLIETPKVKVERL